MDQDIDIESPCIDLGECCGRHRWLAVGSLTVVDDGGGFYLPDSARETIDAVVSRIPLEDVARLVRALCARVDELERHP